MTLGKRTSTTVTILPLFTLFALPFFLFPSLFYLQPLFLQSRVSSLFSFKTFYLSFPASILFSFRVLVSCFLRVFFFVFSLSLFFSFLFTNLALFHLPRPYYFLNYILCERGEPRSQSGSRRTLMPAPRTETL